VSTVGNKEKDSDHNYKRGIIALKSVTIGSKKISSVLSNVCFQHIKG